MAKDAPRRPTYSGKIDLAAGPGSRPTGSLAAPFNGQDGRREIFAQIMAAHSFAAIVETGTYHGRTTRYMAEQTRLPVYSIEANSRSYRAARKFLSGCPGITLILGDSATVLPQKIAAGEIPNRHVFCYLDAHWEEDLPLADEIEAVTSAMTDFVILIDDFQVPDDPGYYYDGYGPGKVLCFDYLRPFAGRGLFVFLPSLPSSEETGAGRGCIVLTAAASIAIALQRAPALRDASLLHWLFAPPAADWFPFDRAAAVPILARHSRERGRRPRQPFRRTDRDTNNTVNAG